MSFLIHSEARVPSGASIARGTDNPRISDEEQQVIDTSPLARSEKSLDPSSPSVDARTFLHLVGDEFGSGSRLEGASSASMLKWVYEFLRSYGERYGVSGQLMEEIRFALCLAETDENQKLYIQQGKEYIASALAEGRPVLIPGGWTSNSMGHAMYYELFPQEGGLVSLRIYNLGAGSSSQQNPLSVVDGKSKVLPYVEWQGIQAKRILDESFFKAIQEMKTKAEIDGLATAYQEDDVYLALKESLQPAKVVYPTSERAVLKTPQKSGLCAFRSLLAFLGSRMDPVQYKQFILVIELFAAAKFTSQAAELLAAPKFTSQAVSNGMIVMRLLKKSHQKLSYKVVEATQRGLLDSIGLERALKTLASTLKTIAQFPAFSSEVPFSFSFCTLGSWFKLPQEAELLISKGAEDVISFHALRQERAYQRLLGISLESTRDSEQPLFEQAKQNLENLFGIFSKSAHESDAQDEMSKHTLPMRLRLLATAAEEVFNEGAFEALENAFLKLIPGLSIAALYSACQKDPLKAQECIVALGSLSHTYFKNCFYISHAEFPDPKRVYLLHKLLRAACALAPIVEPQLPVDDARRFSNSSEQELAFSICQAAIEEDIERQTSTEGSFKYIYFLPICTLSNKGVIEFDPEDPPGLPELLYEIAPEAVIRTRNSVPNFSNLSKPEQDAYLYVSDHLPLWIRSLIDCDFRLNYLRSGVVAPMSLDREWKERPFDFEIMVSGDIAKAEFKIPEMDKRVFKLYLELDEDSNKYNGRYARSYPPFTSSEMRKVVGKLQRIRPEKETLCAKAASYKCKLLSDEEFRELLHLTSERREQRIIEVVAYFTAHREKLMESDYQTLFRILLFHFDGSKRLHEEGENGSHFLHLFLEENYTHFCAVGELQTATFLLHVMRDLASYFPHIPLYTQVLDRVRLLMKHKSLDPFEKSLLCVEVMEHLCLKEYLTIEEVGELLEAAVFYTQTPVPAEWKEIGQERTLQRALIVHARAIADTCLNDESRHLLMNRLMTALYSIEEKGEWKIESEDPLQLSSVDGRYSFFPCDAVWIGKGMRPLPSSILKHPHFKALFPAATHAVITDNGAFYLIDQHGKETLVNLDGNRLTVEQKKGEIWLRFLPSDIFLEQKGKNEIQAACQSRYLVEHFTHWIDPNDPRTVIVCDRDTGAHCYTFTVSMHGNAGSRVNLVQRHSDGAFLSEPSKALIHAEDPSYIHEWYVGVGPLGRGTLIEIELPRFGLTFVNQGECFVSCEYPGYRLEVGARLPSLVPFTNYLILTHKEEKTLVFMPRQFCHALTENDREVLEPRFKIDRHLEFNNPLSEKFFVYSLQTQEQLSPDSREAGIFLTYLYTLIQDYEQAAKLMKEFGECPGRLSSGEIQIFQAITNIGNATGDSSGNGLVLRVQAGLLLFHQQMIVSDELVKDYLDYLEHARHATVLSLDKEEEVLLCKAILDRGMNPLVFMHLQSLDPSIAGQLENIPSEQDQSSNVAKIKPIVPRYLFSNDSKKVGNEPLVITRSGEVIKRNLNHFYHVALNGSDEQSHELAACIPYLTFSQKGKYHDIARFLETVFNHREAFRPCPPFAKNDFSGKAKKKWKKARKTWAKEVIKTAKSLMAPQLRQENPAVSFPVFTDSRQKEEILPIAIGPLCLPQVPLMGCGDEMTFVPVAENRLQGGIEKARQEVQTLQARTQESLVKAELESIVAQFTFEPSQDYLPVSMERLNELDGRLNTQAIEDQTCLKDLELTLLTLANQSHSPTRTLEQWGGLRKVISKEDLILAFGKGDFTYLVQQNPELSQETLATLMNLVGTYLLHATRVQQIQRARAIIADLNTIPDEENEMKIEATGKLRACLLTETRLYDPSQFPAFLVFEYATDKLLYPKQIALITDILSGKGVNQIHELCMGSGKSKIILPLLGLLRADGQALSLVLTPTPLFEDMVTNTHSVMKDTLQQRLRTLHFDRNTPVTPLYLESVRDTLLAVIRNKQCLAMTMKSIHCLVLRMIELTDKHLMSDQETMPREVELLQEMVSILMTSGYPLLDEGDSLLNILHDTSFAIGEALPPDENELALIGEIYIQLYSHPELHARWALESDGKPDKTASVLTEKSYFEETQQLLANIMLDRFGEIDYPQGGLKEKIKVLISSTPRHEILNYLLRKEEPTLESDPLLKGLDPDVFNLLLLLRKELCSVLPHTLLKVSGKNYGMDVRECKGKEIQGEIAIPFAGARRPNKESNFAHPYVTINYTFQIFAKEGISVELIENQLKRLQGAAVKQLIEEGTGTIEETQAWKQYLALRGSSNLPLFNYKPEQLQAVVNEMNANHARRIEVVQKALLPLLQLYPEKMSCNAINSVSLFERLIAITGTSWLGKSVNDKLTSTPDLEIIPKTLVYLHKPENGHVHETQAETTRELIADLPDCTLLIDSGGYCKDEENEMTARMLSERFNQPIFYYDKADRQVETDGHRNTLLEKSTTPIQLRKGFLDQGHTIGADVVLDPEAKGWITIGEKMLFRDLAQAAWRMRGIGRRQTVGFILSQRVKEILLETLHLPCDHHPTRSDILLFSFVNQCREQEEHHQISLPKKEEDQHQMVHLRTLLDPTLSQGTKRTIHRVSRSLWIKPGHRTATQQFGNPEKGDMECTLEVEREIELDVDRELSVETSAETGEQVLGEIGGTFLRRAQSLQARDLFPNDRQISYFALSLYFAQIPELASFAQTFEGIDVTINYMQWSIKNLPSVNDLSLFGEHRTPAHYLTVRPDNRVMIHSKRDQKHRLSGSRRYHLTLGWMNPKDAATPLTEEQKQKIIKIKFLNGNSDYTREEIAFLQEWFLNEGPERMREFYLTHVLSGFPKKRVKYHGSTLEHVFRTLLGNTRPRQDQTQTIRNQGVQNPKGDTDRKIKASSMSASSSSSVAPSTKLAVGFARENNNCWCNALLQMIVQVPSLLETYQQFANWASLYSDKRSRQYGNLLSNAFEKYEKHLKQCTPIPASVSQDVRIALNHFFPDMIQLSSRQTVDAYEALQLIMGVCQRNDIEMKTQQRYSPLYTPIETTRTYRPLGTPREPESARLESTRNDPSSSNAYTRLNPDLSSTLTHHDYQIFVDLQNQNHLSFEDHVRVYFSSERIDSEPAVYLRADNLVQDFSLKNERRQFAVEPNEFLLSVKRFGFNGAVKEGFKITSPLAIPRSFSLPKGAIKKEPSPVYVLDAFIVHSGDYNEGHYITYRKIKGTWVECNDATVKVVSETEIDHILANPTGSLYTSYIHHYTKRTDDSSCVIS